MTVPYSPCSQCKFRLHIHSCQLSQPPGFNVILWKTLSCMVPMLCLLIFPDGHTFVFCLEKNGICCRNMTVLEFSAEISGMLAVISLNGYRFKSLLLDFNVLTYVAVECWLKSMFLLQTLATWNGYHSFFTSGGLWTLYT